MSVVKLIDDYLLQFGNERFVEGWNGQQERVANLLEVHAIEVDEGGGCWCKCGQVSGRSWDYQEHLIALIKGEK